VTKLNSSATFSQRADLRTKPDLGNETLEGWD